MENSTFLGIIGGSGVYNIEGLHNPEWRDVQTPWGLPSSRVLTGVLNDVPIAFLPRHGEHHTIAPAEINYRANIDALKRLGVTDVVSIAACGSFRDSMAPGDFVIVDQFIDRTIARVKSFFGTGCVAHVAFSHPVCDRLRKIIAQACQNDGVVFHSTGTYLAMEGPQFSTMGESKLYRNWGCDVIGMTGMPEAKLAREAELCYATIAMVTDYDSWSDDKKHVTTEDVMRVMGSNVHKAKNLIVSLTQALSKKRHVCSGGCDRALQNAIMTPPSSRDPVLLQKLDAIAKRVLHE